MATKSPLRVCSPKMEVFAYRNGKFERMELDKEDRAVAKREYSESFSKKYQKVQFAKPIMTDMGFVCAEGTEFYPDGRNFVVHKDLGPVTIYIVNPDITQDGADISILEARLDWRDGYPEYRHLELTFVKEESVLADFSKSELKLFLTTDGGRATPITNHSAIFPMAHVSYQVFHELFPSLYAINGLVKDNVSILKLFHKYRWLRDKTPIPALMGHIFFEIKQVPQIHTSFARKENKTIYECLGISKEQFRALIEYLPDTSHTGNYITNYTILSLLKFQRPTCFRQPADEMLGYIGHDGFFRSVMTAASLYNISIQALMDYIQFDGIQSGRSRAAISDLYYFIMTNKKLPNKPLSGGDRNGLPLRYTF